MAGPGDHGFNNVGTMGLLTGHRLNVGTKDLLWGRGLNVGTMVLMWGYIETIGHYSLRCLTVSLLIFFSFSSFVFYG